MKRLIAATALALAVVGGGAGTAVAQQTGVTPGAFCTPQGATGTTSAGTVLTCTVVAGETQPRWQQQGPAVVMATQVNAPTQVNAQPMPNTGVLSVRVAAFGVLLAAFGWVLVSVVRPRWRGSRPRMASDALFGSWNEPPIPRH